MFVCIQYIIYKRNIFTYVCNLVDVFYFTGIYRRENNWQCEGYSDTGNDVEASGKTLNGFFDALLVAAHFGDAGKYWNKLTVNCL